MQLSPLNSDLSASLKISIHSPRQARVDCESGSRARIWRLPKAG